MKPFDPLLRIRGFWFYLGDVCDEHGQVPNGAAKSHRLETSDKLKGVTTTAKSAREIVVLG